MKDRQYIRADVSCLHEHLLLHLKYLLIRHKFLDNLFPTLESELYHKLIQFPYTELQHIHPATTSQNEVIHHRLLNPHPHHIHKRPRNQLSRLWLVFIIRSPREFAQRQSHRRQYPATRSPLHKWPANCLLWPSLCTLPERCVGYCRGYITVLGKLAEAWVQKVRLNTDAAWE